MVFKTAFSVVTPVTLLAAFSVLSGCRQNCESVDADSLKTNTPTAVAQTPSTKQTTDSAATSEVTLSVSGMT